MPEESGMSMNAYGQRGLTGYNQYGHKELAVNEVTACIIYLNI